MKSIFLSFTITLITLSASGQYGDLNKEKVDEKFGFRDIKLETPFVKFSGKEMVKVEEEPLRKYYKSKIENLNLGDYSLKEITYIFYRDTLVSILIQTKGIINSSGLLKILNETYGKGFQGNNYIEQYLWPGDKVTLFFDQNSVTNDAILTISSNQFDLRMRTEESERNKKTGNSDF